MARKSSRQSAKVAKKAAATQVAATPILLAGGNLQSAKGDGDAPVRAYIAAMPQRQSSASHPFTLGRLGYPCRRVIE